MSEREEYVLPVKMTDGEVKRFVDTVPMPQFRKDAAIEKVPPKKPDTVRPVVEKKAMPLSWYLAKTPEKVRELLTKQFGFQFPNERRDRDGQGRKAPDDTVG